MKILSIVGARPQFIKAAPVCRALRKNHSEILVHTGQHYDYAMSKVFFEGLDIPAPDHNLEVGSGSHAAQTAAMLVGLERVMQAEKPDMVLVYGDTNSTLAGAMAAAKLNLPLAHVEAGLRSFNRTMPEEVNRILTDKISTLLFCPTHASIENLRVEGIETGVHLVGDVMFDVAVEAAAQADAKSKILEQLDVQRGKYLVVTVHRASNTDDVANLRNIVEALLEMNEPIVLPLHPRTKKCLETAGLFDRLKSASHIRLTQPLSYLDFVMLQKHARKILTDSGGVQKEACFHRVPCVTLRDETEWVETVESGWNVLVGTDKARILEEARRPFSPSQTRTVPEMELWDGRASQRISAILQTA